MTHIELRESRNVGMFLDIYLCICVAHKLKSSQIYLPDISAGNAGDVVGEAVLDPGHPVFPLPPRPLLSQAHCTYPAQQSAFIRWNNEQSVPTGIARR